jgi:trk system potassium uptake protein TrkA
VLVGAILRDGEMITPRAETVIRPHDRVIIAARAAALKKVEKLFAVRVDYFLGWEARRVEGTTCCRRRL